MLLITNLPLRQSSASPLSGYATASTLFRHGITHIDSAPQAAEALRPLAGDFAYLLFALGIIGTGLLAVPILAGSAAYAVAETFRF